MNDNYHSDLTICLALSLLCLSASSFAQSSSGSEPQEGSSPPGPLFGGDVTEPHLQELRDCALSMNLSLTPQRLRTQVLGLFCQGQGLSCSLLRGNSRRGSPCRGTKPHLPSTSAARRTPALSPTAASSFLPTCEPAAPDTALGSKGGEQGGEATAGCPKAHLAGGEANGPQHSRAVLPSPQSRCSAAFLRCELRPSKSRGAEQRAPARPVPPLHSPGRSGRRGESKSRGLGADPRPAPLRGAATAAPLRAGSCEGSSRTAAAPRRRYSLRCQALRGSSLHSPLRAGKAHLSPRHAPPPLPPSGSPWPTRPRVGA